MFIGELTGQLPASFEAVGIDPETGEETKGTINIKLNRIAFKTITKETFQDAMKNADKEPEVIGRLLAGDGDTPPMLGEWELFEDAEQSKMLPITCENIIGLPFDFVTELTGAVMGRLFQQTPTAGNSPAGSAQAENTNSAQTLASAATPKNSEQDGDSLRLAAIGELPRGNSNDATMQATGS